MEVVSMNKDKNIKRFWPFLLLIPLAIAIIAGWILLPDTLVMQISMGGQTSKTMPKMFGLLIPAAAGILGTVYATSTQEKRRPRGFIVFALAVVVLVMIFIFNL